MNILWESCFGGSKFEYVSDLVETDSGYLILAKTESDDGDISNHLGGNDIWLLKTDYNGNLLYEKCLGGSNGDGAKNLLKINDSLYYICGATKSYDGDVTYNPYPDGHANYWTIKINQDGDIIWDKVFGGIRMEYVRDGIITNDSGVIHLGTTNSEEGDNTLFYGGSDVWFYKLNSQGERQWDFSLGGKGLDSGGSIIQTSDGGYAVAASTNGAGGGNFDSTCNYHGLPYGYQDAWIIKLDSLRNIEWQQCYGGFYHESAASITELNDGYIILSSTGSADGDVVGYHGTPGHHHNSGDIWVFKIDFQGNMLWQKCLGGTYSDHARNIFITSDGGFMVVGNTTSNDGDVIGYHGEGMGIWGDIWFVKLSAEGEIQWQYCYGGNGDERIYYGVIQKSDYHYVIAIETDTDPWQCGGPMYYDVRLVEISDTLIFLNEQSMNKKENIISIFPNPAQTEILVKIKDSISEAELKIFNSSGQVVRSERVFNNSRIYNFDVRDLSGGLYVMGLLKNGMMIENRKIIVDGN